MGSKAPYYFDEFFASGLEESVSPFLTKKSQRWAKNLSLKSSLLGGFFLLLAFITHFFHPTLSHLFLVMTYFFAGTRALIETAHDLKNLEINIEVLMTLAAFLSVLIGSALEGGLLLVLFSISGAMEETVSKKSKSAVTKLRELAPTFAKALQDDGTTVDRSIREIEIGTKLLVRAGEIVPLDGDIVEGESYVNLVHLTGENQPVSKKVGDDVQAGARNLDGTLTISVTRTSADSTLMKIITLIHQAQEMKPKLQRFLDRFSKIYATTIIALSAFFALVLPWILHIPYLGDEGGIYRALAFLIAASPCALIIATPTAYLSAISACAKKGILLKGGITLDALAAAKKIVFDKTGTLTTGSLECLGIEPNASPDIVAIAAGLERNANHPIATAILSYAEKQSISPAHIENFLSVPGSGLEGTWNGNNVAIGNPSFIMQKTGNETLREKIQGTDAVIAALLVENNVYIFTFQDEVREGIDTMVADLKTRYNLESIMLTGDHKTSAETVGKTLGIDQVLSELRPEDKMETISKLAEQGHIAMVGDGVNDAPALARASVGIAMGTIGSDTAIDASDIVLLHDDLQLIGWLTKKAHQTTRIVKQNLTLALGVILLATTPALLGYIPLWLAVILHEGGTLLVGLNSLRLLVR